LSRLDPDRRRGGQRLPGVFPFPCTLLRFHWSSSPDASARAIAWSARRPWRAASPGAASRRGCVQARRARQPARRPDGQLAARWPIPASPPGPQRAVRPTASARSSVTASQRRGSRWVSVQLVLVPVALSPRSSPSRGALTPRVLYARDRSSGPARGVRPCHSHGGHG
jgi:hypothetical protein